MTEVDIVSGFLGAGKTTFMKKLVAEAFSDEKVVIVENEFGEIGIDSGFLKDTGIQVSEINGGCVCCTLVGDFTTNLHEVIKTYHPDRILVEPSGVAKLSDIEVAVLDVGKTEEIHIGALVTIVNALKAKKQMKAFGEFFKDQIEHATAVVLSRTQKMDEAKLEDTVKDIKALNPKAVVITTPWDDLSGKQIMDAIMGKDNLEVFELAEKHHAEEEAEHHHHHHDHDHDDHDHDEHEHHDHDHDEHDHDHDEHDHDHEGHEHHHHHHADDIFTTWGRETPHKFTKETIENALKTLADSEDYGYIVRSKGIVPAEDGTWIYFDLVDGEYEIRTGEPDVTGKLVVIGTDVVEDKVAELFGL
ncbi:MAG: GTP-binding protein [Lachnospiraceae bacterium]|nr:GTP-binding protein [Lachnospiraceae bacterium]MDD7664926.1 GTP-binding protein [Lachnospiraceae bacterium]MDY4164342.1 CobW family GTP-binding protein [Lachnospiraceae bacterium]